MTHENAGALEGLHSLGFVRLGTRKKKAGRSPPKRYSSLVGNPDESFPVTARGENPARRWGASHIVNDPQLCALTYVRKVELGRKNPVGGGGARLALVPLRQVAIFSDAVLSR